MDNNFDKMERKKVRFSDHDEIKFISPKKTNLNTNKNKGFDISSTNSINTNLLINSKSLV